MKRRTMNDDDDAFWIVSLCDLHRFLCLRERVYVRLCVCVFGLLLPGDPCVFSLSLLRFSCSPPPPLHSLSPPKTLLFVGRKRERVDESGDSCRRSAFVSREKKTQAKEKRESEREREKGKKGNTSHMHHERASSLVISVSLAVSRFPFRGCHSSLAFSCSYCCYCAPLLLPLK